MTHVSLSPEDISKLQANFDAAKRAIARIRAGEPHDERCAFCHELIAVTGFPTDPPYTSFVTGCPCGKSAGQFKGI